MAQLAVSVAGAAAGFVIGGPVGAQIGWAAGSLIGAALAPGAQGPRLSDGKVQISSYGAALGIVYGGVRKAGSVIWSTDLVESEQGGGKGGPSASTFTYSVSCAVAIAENEIGGIRRIWADAKLVYDIRETASDTTRAASAQFAQFMTVYLGTESQLPDATIEAVEGAGNVEAYRGVAYVVFTDLPLAEYGNRVPIFSFETTTAVVEDVSETLLEPLRVYPWTGDRPVHSHGDTLYTSGYWDGFASSTDFDAQSASNAAAFLTVSHLPPWGYTGSDWMGLYRNDLTVSEYNIDADQLGVEPENLYYHTGVAGSGAWDIDDRTWNHADFDTSLALAKGPRYLEIFGNGGGLPTVVTRVEGLVLGGGPSGTVPFLTNTASGLTNPGAPLPSLILSVAYSYPLIELKATRVPTHADRSCYPGEPCAAENSKATLPGDSNLCISCAGDISVNHEWVITSGTAKILCNVEYRSGVLYQNALGPVLLPADPDYSNAAYWDAARTAAIAAGTMQPDVTYPVVVSSYATGTPPAPWSAADAGSALLSDIVTDICERAGLSASDIDVSALDDVVQGYKILRQMPARQAIEPLRQAFWFDAVENGGTIEFVKRGGAAVASIGPDDLGAGEGQAAGMLVRPVRAQETELPAEVNVAYEVRDADYQVGVQQSRRVTTGSQQVVGAELSIVMPDSKGAEVADVLMVDAWQGRTERRFSTTRAFTQLLPCDVIELDDGEFSYLGRITEKLERGPVIDWALRDTAIATYSPNVQAGTTSGGGGSVTFAGPLRLQLMDLPALRDVDDDAGFYAAAAGYGTYRGGRLYKSEAGSDYGAIESLNVAAAMGVAQNALANFSGGNMLDETNAVSVELYSGSLASVTRAQLLNGGNACVIGSEVLQFQRATVTGTNTWRLTGLLRGRRGTEQHIGTHTLNERFVLLNVATIYRVAQSVAQIGTALYKAVPYGGAVVDAAEHTFENTAAALRPLSPVHLVATPLPGGGYAVRWVRRTRIGGAWADYIDAPLSEVSESYRVRVLDGSTELDTQTVSSQAAAIASDYPGRTLEVVQLSASVGPGFPATLILD